MARYERSYNGERRTYGLRVMLTLSERDELGAAAASQGAPTLSTYARELLFRRSVAVVAGTRRNPEAKALMRELSAIGNNLNQIARHLNSTGDLRDWGELREAMTRHKEAISRVLSL
jgi:hypothetical protein